MENKNRLIISLILLVVFWFMISLSGSNKLFSILLSVFILLGGIWSFVEAILFVKKKENRDALPLGLMALYLAFYAVFLGIATIVVEILDLTEGGIFQGISYLLVFVALVLYPILGIWAIIKGINLIRDKKDIRLGIISLVSGIIITIPVLIYLIITIISVISAMINPQYE